MKSPYHKDDDGFATRAGDIVAFSYGIPPVHVKGEIVNRNGDLYILTPNHSPCEFKLKHLRRYVGAWYRDGRKGGKP